MKGDYDFAIWRIPGATATVEHWDKGDQLWCLVTVRIEHKCVVTGEPIPMGSEAFLPMTNADNRRDRISMEGMNKLAGEIE